MKTQVFKINRKVYVLLIDNQIDNFTVVQLRDAYIESNLGESCPIEARKFIYRQILRLQDKGLLLKQSETSSRGVIYSKTELFNTVTIIPLTKNVEQSVVYESAEAIDDGAVVAFLQSELQQYQVDLSSSIAESEEYERLHKRLPELKPQLEIYFMQARDKCSRLLGQVTAIETILTDCQKA